MSTLKCLTIVLVCGLAVRSLPAAETRPTSEATSAAVLLEKGIYTEETVGDLDAAIRIYLDIVHQAKPGRTYAAQAQYRLAMCYLKKSDKTKAATELRRLIDAYPELPLAQKSRSALEKIEPRPSPYAVFGPVIERVVNFTGEDCLLDLDTGELMALPKEAVEGGSKTAMAWAEQHGIDVGGGAQAEVKGLIGFDIIAFPVNNKVWDLSGDAGLLADKNTAFSLSKPGNPVYLSAKGGVPATYKFQTREGGLGVIQIVGFTDDPKGTRIRYKLLQSASSVPRVVMTTPAALANDVDPALDKITVTFDRPMMDKSWSWTMYGVGETSIFPQKTGEPSYDSARTTCTLSVKLDPGKVYWVGANGPGNHFFQTTEKLPAQPYAILFATKSADGKPTPLPENLVKQAREINAAANNAAAGAPVASGGELTVAQLALIEAAEKQTTSFLSLMRDGWIDDAYKCTSEEYRKNHNRLKDFAAMIDVSKTKVTQVLVSDAAACVLAAPVLSKDGKDLGAMGFGLVRFDKGWLIRDIDALRTDAARQKFVDGFQKANPQSTSAVTGLDPLKAKALMENMQALITGVYKAVEQGDNATAQTLLRQEITQVRGLQEMVRGTAAEAPIKTGLPLLENIEAALAKNDVVQAKKLLETLGAMGPSLGQSVMDALAAQPDATTAQGQSAKANLINWVEKYFSENYRDITARKTIEWGEPETVAGGNVAIRYKYLATIWDKDQKVIEQRFTFTPEGKYVSAETIEKGPTTQPAG